jgi:hypothetical protein
MNRRLPISHRGIQQDGEQHGGEEELGDHRCSLLANKVEDDDRVSNPLQASGRIRTPGRRDRVEFRRGVGPSLAAHYSDFASAFGGIADMGWTWC